MKLDEWVYVGMISWLDGGMAYSLWQPKRHTGQVGRRLGGPLMVFNCSESNGRGYGPFGAESDIADEVG